ncbi:MAG: ABC transporter ATP-binding protein [Armatimonadetes bacterium]|nr:ABC transporter ATP-binding protein [Armatimonadota bacterium]
MLRVTNLVKYYKRFLAVDDLTFEVADGEIVGLLGPNGAGKTTVLRCVTGIVQASEGTIEIDGISLESNEEEVKRRIAFVPEVPTPYEMLTVWEHLRFIAMAYQTMDGFEERADALMRRFDLHEKRNDMVLSLSKGMKQKLAIACAFIHDAQVILLDEPLIGIDPKGVHELKDMISEAKHDGKAILISTHMLDTAERLCDRIIILRKGSIVAEGNLAELHDSAKMGTDASLEDVFLTLTEEAESVETAAVP